MRGQRESKVFRTWKTKFFRAFQSQQYGLARILLASFLGLFVITLAIALLFSSYTGRNYLRYNSVSAFLANPEPDAEFTITIHTLEKYLMSNYVPGYVGAEYGGTGYIGGGGGGIAYGPTGNITGNFEEGTTTPGTDCYSYNIPSACKALCDGEYNVSEEERQSACSAYENLKPQNLCLINEDADACNTVCQDVQGFSAEERKKACDQFYNITGCGFDQGKRVCDGDCRDASGGGRECWLEGRWTASLVIDSEPVTPRESPTAIAGPTGNCSIPSFYNATPMCFGRPVGKDCILDGKSVDCNDAGYLKSSENNNSSTIVDPAAEGQRAQLEAECNRSDIGLNLVLAKICLAAGYTLPEGQPTAKAGPTGNCSIPSFYNATPMCFGRPVGKDCILDGKSVDCNDAGYLKSLQDTNPSTALDPAAEGQTGSTSASNSDNSVTDCNGFFAKIGCAVKSVVSGIGSAAQAVGGAVVKAGEAAKGWLWGTDPFNGWVKTCKEFPNVADCVEAKSLALSSGKCEDPVYMNNPDYSYVCALEGGNGTGFSQSGDTGQSLRTDVTIGDPIRNYGETDKRDCLNDNQLACAKYCMTFPSDNICTSGISTKNPGTNENSGSTSNILNITFSPSAIYDSQGNFIGRIFFPGSPIR